MPFLTDKQLFVTDEGSGDAIVMLPGLGGTSSMYQPQAEALAGTHRLVRIDPAGSGRSVADGPFGIEGWADDVVAVIDALGIGQATVVAHSLGTLVAADVVRRHPARVTSLVALGPVRSQPDPVKEATRGRAATVREDGMEPVVDGILGAAVGETARRLKPVVAAFVRESLLAQPPAGYAASCEALADVTDPHWDAVTVPTVLVGGDEDKLAAPQLVDAVEADLTDVTRERVAGAGHWLSVEEPELVTDVVRKAATS